MRGMRGVFVLIGVLAFAAVPASASASPIVLAPPGHSGANQYFETIPTSSGQAAPPGSVRGSGSPHAGAQALAGLGHGRSADARLSRLGTDGQAAAALAASTAPNPARGASARDARAAAASSSGSGGSVASGISHALTSSDSGGLGLVFPLILVTALVIALAAVVARLRPGPKPQ